MTRRAGKLGKLPLQYDSRTLQLGQYVDLVALGDPPVTRDWLASVPDGQWGMFGNDSFGDCVEAGAAHLEQLWSAAESNLRLPITDAQVLAAYTAITGFDPNDPTTDQGTEPLAALNYWRKHGIARHKISAFAQVNIHTDNQLKWAIELFGGLFAAIDFPSSGMSQFDNGQPWTVVPGSPIDGGHMIVLGAYSTEGIDCITWGQRQRMTWDFWSTYRSEAFAVLSPQWTAHRSVSPGGIDLKTLRADLSALNRTP